MTPTPSAPADRPLAGRRVVTTRDEPGELDRLLVAAGAEVVHVPLIAIAEPEDGGAACRAALAAAADYDWVIVTSRHGAERVAPALRAAPQVRVAAVGISTAATLERLAGRPPDLVPPRQTAADLVGALVPRLSDGAPARVLAVLGDLAPDTVVRGLRAAGHVVDTVVAYRTVPRALTPAERARALDADAVVFASGSAAAAWSSAIGVSTPPVVIAIGPTTAASAAEAGIAVTGVASSHDVAGLIAALVAALCSRHPPGA